MKLPLPSRKIHPDEFFTEYLGSIWAILSDGQQLPSWKAEIDVCLQNKKGVQRTYNLAIVKGDFCCTIQPAKAPIAFFHASLFDWRQFVSGVLPLILRHANEHPIRIKQEFENIARASKERFDPNQIKDLPGQIEIAYTDDAGDLLSVLILIGNGNGPKASLQLNESTLFKILKMESGFSAILSSELEVGGNAGYLIKVFQELEVPSGLN